MKKSITLISCMFITLFMQAQLSKELNLNAGALSTALDSAEKSTITNLTLTGTIDSRDFRTMRDSMPVLSVIDLLGTTVTDYSGKLGTSGDDSITYPMNMIPDNAFKNPNAYYGKMSLISVILPSAVTSIGGNAFAYCKDIVSVVMPSSVTAIGISAFQYCISLDLDSLPSSLVSMERTAFLNCISLGKLTVPPLVTSIGAMCFYGCNGLSYINIPASVTYIGEPAFSGCTGNVSVDAGNNYYSDIDGILYDKNITVVLHCPVSKTGSVTIPASVTTIANSAFYNCIGLTDILIPSSVSAIRVAAFQGCIGWSDIRIPESVNIIETYAFFDCRGNITVNEDNLDFSSRDGVLFDKEVTRIKYYPPFKSGPYVIPSTVTTIEAMAFFNCGLLSSVTIPSGVASMETGAFYGCNRLGSIILEGDIPIDLSTSSSVFTSVPLQFCTLYIPAGSLSNYQAAAEWKNFNHIVEGNGFWLSSSAIYFPAASESEFVIVNSNSVWSASSGSDWVSVFPETNNTGTDTIIITVTENHDVNIRTSIITVSADGVLPQIITVSQEGNPTGITSATEKELILYPNPAENIIYIHGGSEKKLISVFNSVGHLVLRKYIYDNQLPINDLSRGEYTITLEEEGQIVTRKFIKL